jgi:hypothetical protein
MPETRRVGGCQCGAVRYVLTSDPLEVYVCHCRECQKQSSSAFGISVIARREAFTVTQGETRRWSRGTDSGRTLHCMFCPNCGSRVWHEGDGLDTISVKGGTFDELVDLSHANHIWTSRKLPGVVIPQQAEQFAQEPG